MPPSELLAQRQLAAAVELHQQLLLVLCHWSSQLALYCEPVAGYGGRTLSILGGHHEPDNSCRRGACRADGGDRMRGGGRAGAAAGGARAAWRASAQRRGPLQSQPRAARPLQRRRDVGVAERARPAAGPRPPAARRRALSLAGRGASHAAAGHDPRGAAPARPPGAGRYRLPQLGRLAHRRAHRRDALLDGRRLHLPPRPRRALRGVRVGAHRAPVPLHAAALHGGALRQRRLERDGRAAGAPPARAGRRGADGQPRGDAARAARDPRHRAPPGERAARGRAAAVAERAHGVPRRGSLPPPRRPVDRLRPRRVGLDRALLLLRSHDRPARATS